MPSRAGTEASFRRGSQIAPGGFLCPGPTVLARDAKASQHRAEFLPSLLAFLLPAPPKKWRRSGRGGSIDLSALDPLHRAKIKFTGKRGRDGLEGREMSRALHHPPSWSCRLVW